VYLRKAWVACALGAMARGYNPDSESLFWAQMIVALIGFVIYFILLIWRRPYIDAIHLVLDLIITVSNASTVLLSLLAIQSDAGTQEAIQWIVLVVQIPCVLLIVCAYLWSSMFYSGYTSPEQICTGKPEPAEGDNVLIEGKLDEDGRDNDSVVAEFDEEKLRNLDLPDSE